MARVWAVVIAVLSYTNYCLAVGDQPEAPSPPNSIPPASSSSSSLPEVSIKSVANGYFRIIGKDVTQMILDQLDDPEREQIALTNRYFHHATQRQRETLLKKEKDILDRKLKLPSAEHLDDYDFALKAIVQSSRAFRSAQRVVKQIIDSHFDLNRAAFFAAREGNVTLLKLLLENGANIRADSDKTTCMLNEAIRHGHLNVVEFLIRRDPALLKTASLGWNPVMTAAFYNRLSILRFLYEQAPETFAYTDGVGKTAMHLAALAGHIDIIEFIRSHAPALMEQPDNQGEPPIFEAAMSWKNNGEVIKYLHQYAQETFFSRNKSQQSIAHLASIWNHPELLDFLLEQANQAPTEDLRNQYIEVLTAEDEQGQNPAHLAGTRQAGFMPIIKFYVRNFSDCLTFRSLGRYFGRPETPLEAVRRRDNLSAEDLVNLSLIEDKLASKK